MIDDHAQIYREAYEQHGESPKSLHWWDYPSLASRYKQLVADLDIKDKTILDAGCGMGDALPFLYMKADNFSYLGMDINPDFIEIAKKRYDGHRFEVGDPFFGKIKGNFDIVISSGVMNAHTENWLVERQQMISSLFKLTGEVLAFNMAGSFNPGPHDDVIAYADTQDIMDYCLSLTSRLILRHHYNKNDFTIVMFK
jgi:SAM-dependent methyltransferase